MSVTLEQVERLRAHAAVSYEEARRALEASGLDIPLRVVTISIDGHVLQEDTP